MSYNTELSPPRRAMIYTVACEIAGVLPELSGDVGAEEIFSAAREFGMGALVASALNKLGLATDGMRAYLGASIRRSILMDNERARISVLLSERGIRHVFLKGALLKTMYPSVGLREMSDFDVLFDQSARLSVRDIMSSAGYTVAEYGSGCHDVYTKPPVYNFEMHVSLFNSLESDVFANHFESALNKSLSEDGTSECKFSPEDSYVYIRAHEYKHYSTGGTGIRSLLDTYIYLGALGKKLDFDYINRELSAIGIRDYAESSATLASKLFSPSFARELYLGTLSLSSDEADMLSYYMGSGLYGNMENKVSNTIARDGGRGAKFRYIMFRLFPPIEWYRVNAPFYYKHRILIPFFVVKRVIVSLFTSPKRSINEINILMKSEGKDKK